MIWRLALVVWLLALLAGLAFYFADDIFVLTQHLLTLDKDGRERIIQIEEIVAKGLGILGTLLMALAAVRSFVQGKQQDTSSGSTTTNTFHREVRVHGDFTLGNKTVNGGKDAG